MGWEGSALIQHGTHLKFGCLQFVFSLVETCSEGRNIDNIKPEIGITTLLREQQNITAAAGGKISSRSASVTP